MLITSSTAIMNGNLPLHVVHAVPAVVAGAAFIEILSLSWRIATNSPGWSDGILHWLGLLTPAGFRARFKAVNSESALDPEGPDQRARDRFRWVADQVHVVASTHRHLPEFKINASLAVGALTTAGVVVASSGPVAIAANAVIAVAFAVLASAPLFNSPHVRIAGLWLIALGGIPTALVLEKAPAITVAMQFGGILMPLGCATWAIGLTIRNSAVERVGTAIACCGGVSIAAWDLAAIVSGPSHWGNVAAFLVSIASIANITRQVSRVSVGELSLIDG